MWIKFSILIFVALVNIILGIIIISRNNNKDKSRFYFSLMCFSSGLWGAGIALTLILISKSYYLLNAKFFYLFATLIFIFFYYFCKEFIYSIKLKNRFLDYFIALLTLVILYIIFFGNFFVDFYVDNYGLHEIENKLLHLIYGVYIIFLLSYSLFYLFKKYKFSGGVSQRNILYIFLATIFSFVLGILFAWYFPRINKHYLDWFGPLLTIIMNLSMFYLLFKKIDE